MGLTRNREILVQWVRVIIVPSIPKTGFCNNLPVAFAGFDAPFLRADVALDIIKGICYRYFRLDLALDLYIVMEIITIYVNIAGPSVAVGVVDADRAITVVAGGGSGIAEFAFVIFLLATGEDRCQSDLEDRDVNEIVCDVWGVAFIMPSELTVRAKMPCPFPAFQVEFYRRSFELYCDTITALPGVEW